MVQVAVALGTAVYLWNAGTGVIEELCATTEEDDYITSLAWAADGALREQCEPSIVQIIACLALRHICARPHGCCAQHGDTFFHGDMSSQLRRHLVVVNAIAAAARMPVHLLSSRRVIIRGPHNCHWG